MADHLPALHQLLRCTACPHSYKSSGQAACPHYIIMMEGLSILTNCHGGSLVCTILIITMTACPHTYKLSWQTTCLHYINCDGPLVHIHINYHSGSLVCTISVIMMEGLSILINYHGGLLVHTHINYCGRPLVCTIL